MVQVYKVESDRFNHFYLSRRIMQSALRRGASFSFIMQTSSYRRPEIWSTVYELVSCNFLTLMLPARKFTDGDFDEWSW